MKWVNRICRALMMGLAWGGVWVPVLVGALPFVLGDQHGSDRPLWVLPVVVMSAMTLIASVSAVVSVWLGRVLRETPVKGVRIEG